MVRNLQGYVLILFSASIVFLSVFANAAYQLHSTVGLMKKWFWFYFRPIGGLFPLLREKVISLTLPNRALASVGNWGASAFGWQVADFWSR